MSKSPFSHRGLYGTNDKRPARRILHFRCKQRSDQAQEIRHSFVAVMRRIVLTIFVWIARFVHWLRATKSRKELLGKLVRVGLVCAALFFGWLLLYCALIFFTLPDVDEVGALFAAESTVITDRNGIELYRIHGDEDRTLVPLEQISDFVEHATIAIEDQRFYERDCLDVRALARVALRLGGAGGGSTITRQHARNALGLQKESLLSRKLKEIVLGCQLEQRYSKDEVLELYLNRIPYGSNAHGVEQAAKMYFAKSASGLTLAESAVLASLPQLPTYYSPYGKHVHTVLTEKGQERLVRGELRSTRDLEDDDFWLGLIGQTFGSGANVLAVGGRTDQVLKNMEEQGYITPEQRQDALAELQTIEFKRARENIRAPHFVLWVREQIAEQFRGQFDESFLESGGLQVTTTLDWNLQQIAEGTIAEIGKTNIDLYNAHNAALLATDPTNGHILAYVGNRDYWDEATDGNVDVVQAPRQPGSSFKPFAYAAAFLNGYGPATVLYDVPTFIGDDTPENFDGKFWGPLTIREALAASRNVPAAKAFFLGGGEEAITALADAMGIPTLRRRRAELSAGRGTPYEYGWPLALGAAEVPLYEMVNGYTTFARGGSAVPLVSILRIEDRFGNLLYETPKEADAKEALDPRVAAMITSILSDAAARPAGYWRDQLSLPEIQTAAKTGTSNKCLKRDEKTNRCLESKPDNTWTIGYTPALVTGVWAGNASGSGLFPKASGIDTASSIWQRFMLAAHKQITIPANTFPLPDGLESAQISRLSGKLASTCTPESKRHAELFLSGETPKEFDDACVQIEIDKLTGLLASDECPIEAREAGSFFRPRSILPDRWPLWEQAVQQWALDLSRSPFHAGRLIAERVEPLNFEEEKDSIFWKTIGTNADGTPMQVFRGTGAFLPLPLPLAPTEKCTLALTPGRMTKPTLQILSPAHNGMATAPSFRPSLRFTVGESVQDIRYELDGRLIAVVQGPNPAEPLIRIPRRFDQSGMHTLRVILTDSYFNEVSATSRFTFREDAGLPQVRILEPTEGTSFQLGETVTISAEALDVGGGVERVQFFLNNILLTTRRGASPFSVSFTLDANTGPATLRVVAVDGAGNEGVDEMTIEILE